jgi:hypothetical protein
VRHPDAQRTDGYSAAAGGDAALNRIDERIRIDGFLQHTRELAGVQIARVGTADNHDRYVLGGRVRSELLGYFATAQSGKRQIQNDRPRYAGFDHAERVLSVLDADDGVPRSAERRTIEITQRVIVFDHEDVVLPRRLRHTRIVMGVDRY